MPEKSLKPDAAAENSIVAENLDGAEEPELLLNRGLATESSDEMRPDDSRAEVQRR
jgi:hypothetical protein